MSLVTEKALRLLRSMELEAFEVIIVDDGSPDRAGEIADQLARDSSEVRVVHHPRNLGYGAAIRAGLAAARFDWIWFTDGDDQFEVEDFRKQLRVCDGYDLVLSFRYKKIYSWDRLLISLVYNRIVRLLFQVRFRDVSSALRMVRREVIEDIPLEASSPFIGAELAIKAQLKGYRVGEVGIQTFPRIHGGGSATSWRNVVATIREMLHCYRLMFSHDYDLPAARGRRVTGTDRVPGTQGEPTVRKESLP